MKRRFGCWPLVMLFIGMLMVAGCASKHQLVAGAPDWVNQGSGAFSQKDQRVFHGIGAVSGIVSQPLAVQAADQRGRADIARQLDTYVSGLLRSHQSSTQASGAGGAQEEQYVDDSLKAITEVSVRGARVIDHWKDAETNTVYSLLRLELSEVTAGMETLQISPALRDFVRSNAQKAFDEMTENHQEP